MASCVQLWARCFFLCPAWREAWHTSLPAPLPSRDPGGQSLRPVDLHPQPIPSPSAQLVPASAGFPVLHHLLEFAQTHLHWARGSASWLSQAGGFRASCSALDSPLGWALGQRGHSLSRKQFPCRGRPWELPSALPGGCRGWVTRARHPARPSLPPSTLCACRGLQSASAGACCVWCLRAVILGVWVAWGRRE